MSTIENIVKSLAYATEHNQGLHLTHEEVPALNACIAQLEAEIRNWQDCYCEFETIAPDGKLKISVLDIYNRIAELNARIAELEAENNRLAELLLNELSQVEIATDLGNKRWTALNKIYQYGEKHNTNWCKRIAQEGLGIKNA